MGSPGTTSTRQKPMAHFDRGLCFEARRGLSSWVQNLQVFFSHYGNLQLIVVTLKSIQVCHRKKSFITFPGEHDAWSGTGTKERD